MTQSENKICQNCKSEFTIEPDDSSYYEQIHVPPPTFCPKCRMIRRLAWWGYRILYKKKCDFIKKEVITTYHPDSPHKIYSPEVWYSDKWDPLWYGRDYDFSRSFFEQFNELFLEVPKPALHYSHSTMTNSEYCSAASELKNCYLAFKADRSENSAYLNAISFLKDCFDVSYSNYSELSYESVNVNKCYQVFHSIDCDECHDVWFSRDLVGCQNCVGCINLRNKNYHIFNQPYTKEDYHEKLKEFDLTTNKGIENFQKQFEEFSQKYPRRQYHGSHNIQVSGDYLYECKNVLDSYWIYGAEDVRYSQLLQAPNSKKCYDHSGFGLNSEWVYETAWAGISANNIKFSFWNYSAHDLEYCFGCPGSGNLFGCVGVRNNEYCILNKKYTKSEYTELVEKIKKQMMEIPYVDKIGRKYFYGEMMPSELCPWAYNESAGMVWFPLNKEESLKEGFTWRDVEEKDYQSATIEIPKHIKEVKDDILKEILKCENCGKNYRLIKMELDFYRRFNLPIPHNCFICRDRARTKLLNPIEIHDRQCAKCNKNIKTSWTPERPEIVYCKKCYQQEVY